MYGLIALSNPVILGLHASTHWVIAGVAISTAAAFILWNQRLRVADRRLAAELEAKNHALIAEQALRQQTSAEAKRLAQIFEATTDFVSTCDASGGLQWMNPAGLVLVGRTYENLSGTHCRDIVPPWAFEILDTQAFPSAIRTGRWFGEIALLSGEREVPVSVIMLAHKSLSGVVQFVSTVARDISALKDAEVSLREGRQRSELINSIATNINAGDDVQSVIHQAVEELSRTFPQYRVRYCSLMPGGACVVDESFEPAAMPSLHGLAFDFATTPDYLAALRGESAVAIADVGADPRLRTAAGFLAAGSVAATLAHTIRTEDVHGVLCLDSDAVHEWTPHEVATIAEVCDYLAAAITGAKTVQDRLLAEERLRTSEERLAVIIENMPVLAFAVSPLGRIVFWNKEAQRVTGYTAAEIAEPQGLEMLLPDPAYRAQVLTGWSSPPTEVRDYEWIIRCKDGQSRTIAWSSISEQVPISGWKAWGIAVDVTERRRADAWRTGQARVLEQLTAGLALNTVLETLVLAIEQQESQLRCSILLLDDANKLRMGVAPSLPAGYNAKVDGYPIGARNGSCGTAAFRRERVIVADISADPLWEGGREMAAEYGLAACWSQPIMGPSGTLMGTLAMYYDQPREPTAREIELIESAAHLAGVAITRRRDEQRLKERAEELARSNSELERFAYVASHDLQEPLRMVTSFTQLLSQRYKGTLDKDADEFIGFAVEGAVRMQRLIEDLLAFSRVSSRPRAPERIAAAAALQRARDNLRSAIAEAKADVTCGDLPEVLADESQLSMVFQNLIGNAIKFHRPGTPPAVHVTARRNDAAWCFEVKDNGIGIDAQHCDKIFAMFQRLHARSVYPGNGIGLAICKRILERHQGRIWVESNPGAGSSFFFTLPDSGADA